MFEYEKRFKLSDEEFSKLEGLDLNWSTPFRLRDITFGPTGENSIKTHGWIVRLREKNNHFRLEYKSPLDKDMKQWEEIGIEVSDFKKTILLLTKINLKPGLVLDRVRRETKLGGVYLVLDDFNFLGKFIEIEISSIAKKQDIAKIQKTLEFLKIENRLEMPPYGFMLSEKIKEDANTSKLVKEYLNSILENSK